MRNCKRLSVNHRPSVQKDVYVDYPVVENPVATAVIFRDVSPAHQSLDLLADFQDGIWAFPTFIDNDAIQKVGAVKAAGFCIDCG